MIAGLGRMLANEVCHRAKICPFAMTGKLGAEGAAKVVTAIHEAVDEGLAYERTRSDMSSSADRPGPRARPGRRGLPGVRRHDPQRQLQRLHRRLLPDVPDRRQGARRQHDVSRSSSSHACTDELPSRPVRTPYACADAVHLRAEPSDYAPAVLVPGDPQRATYIAETFFDPGARCVNDERGALGYTGTFQGAPISVQSVGMGGPSAAIYYSELIQLGVQRIVRVGTAGGLQPRLRMADTVVAIGATADDRTVGAAHRRRPARAGGDVLAAGDGGAPGPRARGDGPRRLGRVRAACSTTPARACCSATRPVATSRWRWRSPCCTRSPRSTASRPSAW